ncbi:MAG: 2-dehydropantoate 2-reductase [Burkholderiaceae bacterium]
MKVCIFGGGAVGGYVAARLCQAGGATVSVIARGAHREAIERDGLSIQSGGESFTCRPAVVTDDPASLGEQDVTFVALKTTVQAGAARAIARLMGQSGYAVFAANGIPWWFKHGSDAPAHLPLLDPEGDLWRLVRPERSLGCVVYSANEVTAPGHIRHLGNNRWVLGEASGQDTDRLRSLVALLRDARLNAEASTDLRREIWVKLSRNASVNTLCALTRLPVDGLAQDDALLAQGDALIRDIDRMAQSCGFDISDQAQAAIESLRRGGAERDAPPVTGLRPSMLQDALAGRPLEVEAILGQVQSLARESNVQTPAIDAALPLLRGLDRSLRQRRV